MSERGFDTEFWTNPFVMKLPKDGKLLYAYLFTNSHCNQAGLYKIAPETIAFETKLLGEDLLAFLKLLEPKVKWYPEENLIWVRSFLRRQAKSSKFVVAAIKSLNNAHIPDDIRADFDYYNQDLLRGVAPSQHITLTKRECVLIRDNFCCQYCDKEIVDAADYEMDHVIPGGKTNYSNLVASCRKCNQIKLDRTPLEAGMRDPKPSPFHGAQATYILRNDQVIREKWLMVFPDRAAVVELILGNIEQYQSILKKKNNIEPSCQSYPSDLSCPATTASADLSLSNKKEGSGGKELDVMKRLYEENLGMLTPIVFEKLKDIRRTYPVKWFEEAIKEAVKCEHRNLKYIEAILERWKVEGFQAPRGKGGHDGQPKQQRRRSLTYIRGSEPVGPEDEKDMP